MNTQKRKTNTKLFCCICLCILVMVTCCVCTGFSSILFAIRPFQVEGRSMYPGYQESEFYITNKFSYLYSEPQRGDVIIFSSPVDSYLYIKRIIAIPGDTVQITSGNVFVNGEELEEPYCETPYTKNGNFLKPDKSITVPDAHYFVMGDNRELSSDSRHWGYVPKENIISKVSFCYWNCIKK